MTEFDLSVGEVSAAMFLRGPGIADPVLDPEPALIAAIHSAKTSITALIFSISLPDVRDALVAKHEAGVAVRIVTDATMAKGATSAVPALKTAGIDIRLWGGNYREAHDKVAVIDSYLLITGSYNWTTLAEKSNIENMFILKGTRITKFAVPAYLTQWNNAYNAGATP
jgi:phosphatidylserine/phosphatidylglycerophosphate/cardiolipin synthase-like enzyme